MSQESPDAADKTDEAKRDRLRAMLAARMQSVQSYPLSFAQQRLWFMDQLAPGNHFYNTPTLLWMKGCLDEDNLKNSLKAIMQRHAPLRTTFGMSENTPVQLVHSECVLPFRRISVENFSETLRQDEARAMAHKEIRKPFDLKTEMPIRVLLIRLHETSHLLVITMHHIVTDAWSQGIFFKDFIACYKNQGAYPSGTKALPIAYADFAQWQRESLSAGVLHEQLAHWAGKLKDAPPLLLPLDYVRPHQQSFRGETKSAQLPASLLKSLNTLGQSSGSTLYMTLLAVFYVLLHRYTGQNDISVGTPSANRTKADMEDLIGFFINTLVMRIKLDTTWTFLELLEEVKRVSLESFEYQEVPFEAIVERIAPQRDLGRNPLIQAIFAVQNVPTTFMHVPGLDLLPEMPELDISRFDLGMHIHEFSGSLFIKLTYNCDIFAASTMQHFLDQWKALLENIVANPQCPWVEIFMLPQEEQHILLNWGRGSALQVDTDRLHHFASHRAITHPEAIAVRMGEQVLTYKELDEQARYWARRLQAAGIGPECIVGIHMRRSVEMIVAVQAVASAGAAFMPLDPEYPPERIRYMLKDSGAKLVLISAKESVGDELDGCAALPITFVENLDQDDDIGSLQEMSASSSLAYVIYTSGSTGTPKGVCVEHAGAVNLVASQIQEFRVGEDSVVLQFASLNFDAAISEIFTAFGAGACLQLVPVGKSLPDRAFIEFLQDTRVSVATLPPSFLAALPYEDLPNLKTLVVAGETCPTQLVKRWAHNRIMLNAYGPTEGTVCATIEHCNPHDDTPPPIGNPIHNVSVFVFDEFTRLCPVNVPGELYIGGAGVARGYLNNPAFTTDRFVHNPLTDENLERLYRSGDRVRWRSDGVLEFIGRVDHQLKIRGHRIEPGEIEHTLSRLEGVRQCVVISRKVGQSETTTLVAYVGVGDSNLDTAQVKAHLLRYLPDYMSPAHVVILPQLPTTPNGKIDRDALPDPGVSAQPMASEEDAPRDTLEKHLAETWARHLSLPALNRISNFFDMGGDSITAATLINHLQEELGEYLYVVSIFEAPTPAQFAEYLRNHYHEALLKRGLAQKDTHGSGHMSLQIEDLDLETLQQQIPPLDDFSYAAHSNVAAAFILSPPRSGSTLLRVMLGANAALSAPPELELLSFNTMQDRKHELSGKYTFWTEGLIRYWMELCGVDADTARAALEKFEENNITAQEMYRILQNKLGDAMLIDKTPSYSLDINILRRAESYFKETKYLYLQRHPCGVIRSFIDARLEQVFYRYPHTFTRRQLSELIWLYSHRNIQEFLLEIPQERKLVVRYEDLLTQPKEMLSGICEFMGVPFDNAMLAPYESGRMTDGIHPLAKMLGDVKFHEHKAINPEMAERWRKNPPGPLAEATRRMAQQLGYDDEATRVRDRVLPQMRPHSLEDRSQFPMSFAQERMWLIDRMDSGNPAYVIPGAWRLEGCLNPGAMQGAFAAMLQRHYSLRTTFAMVQAQPMQIIHPDSQCSLGIINLDESTDKQAQCREIANEIACTSFNLESGPLFRAALITLSDNVHVLCYAMHHIISDGWSMGIFFRELSILYAAYNKTATKALPPPTFQYPDYAVWQRETYASGLWNDSIAFWKNTLSEAPPINLPLDFPRKSAQTFSGGHCVAKTASGVKFRLDHLAREENATPFMAQIAVFAAMLSRWTGDDDLLIGTPVAGRNLKNAEGIIGCFLNTIVLRLRIAPAKSFRELLRDTRKAVVEAFAHQDIPFEKLLEEIAPQRDLSRFPLFQVLFVGHNTPAGKLDFDGVKPAPFPIEVTHTKMDLSVHVDVLEEELAFFLQFNTDLFRQESAERLLQHLCIFMQKVCAAPDTAMGEIGLGAIQGNTFAPWDSIPRSENFRVPSTDFKTIPACFDDIVSRFPSHLAYRSKETECTYLSLQRASLQLAMKLQANGLKPGDRVALILDRTPWIFAAMLAVGRCGAAYVPILRDTPDNRLKFLLDDIAPHCVITDSQDIEQISGVLVLRVTKFETDGDCPALFNHAIPEAMAYILYTSGSTGRPKGVMQSQQNVVWHSNTYINNLGISSDDVLTLIPPYIFDASVMDIYGALFSGACLLDADPKAFTPKAMREWLVERPATLIHATPTVFRNLFLGAEERFQLPDARLMVLGGEAATVDDWALWKRHFPADGALVNGLGPTESTLALQAVFHADSVLDTHMLPVGVPVPGMEIRILDKHGYDNELHGELVLCSDHLATGYWQQPEQSAGVFTEANPPNAHRRYHTGDLVRMRTDGQLIHAGRRDAQLKIRGHRIEVAEVESAFRSLVEQIVVVPHSMDGQTRLCAYYVNKPEMPLNADNLRRHAAQQLPAHMMPDIYLQLDTLPLTATGKLDRLALPKPQFSVAQIRNNHQPPQGEIECMIARIWEEVLGRGPIGARDSFFDWGGNSLLAMQTLAKIEDTLSARISLKDFFQEATVEGVARRVHSQSDLTLPPFVKSEHIGSTPLSFAQSRLYFLQRLYPDSAAYSIPIAIRFQGGLRVEALKAAFVSVVQRHDLLRAVIQEHTGSASLCVQDSVQIPWETRDFAGDDKQLQAVLSQLSAQPFTLLDSLLYRVVLVRSASTEHVFLLVMHHIITDAWSIGVLLEDIRRAYADACEGKQTPLAALPFSYADYALWQRGAMNGDTLEKLREYWLDALREMPSLDLPTDWPRPSRPDFAGASIHALIPTASLNAVSEIARKADSTLYMALLSVFAIVLGRNSGQRDFGIGCPIANRPHPELKNMVGLFVNVLVLRCNLEDNPTFPELVKRMRGVTLGAYDHAELPFEALVEAMHPDRDPSRTPIVQTMLTLHNTPRSDSKWHGVEGEWVQVNMPTSRFDLSLHLAQTEHGLACRLEYNTGIFDAASAERLLRQFELVLQQCGEAATAHIDDLKLLSAAEAEEILRWEKGIEVPLPWENILQPFEDWAHRQPDAIAITSDALELNYAQLNAQANRLARWMQNKGVSLGDRVCICLPRTAERIVAVLACLKCGVLFVPIDTESPGQRCLEIINDAQPKLILTDDNLKVLFTEVEIKVSVVHEALTESAAFSPENLNTPITPDTPIYILYTSGSTGKPKGVVNTHKPLVNFLHWMTGYFNISPSTRILHKTAFGFDVSLWEQFLPLVNGGVLCILPSGKQRDPQAILDTIVSMKVDMVHFGPAMLPHILAQPEAKQKLSGVQHLLTGGEQLSASLREKCLDALSGKLHHLYGPTETTIDVTAYTCSREDTAARTPIGVPIQNCRIFIQDAAGHRTPVGAPGELLVAGMPLAQGYWNAPELSLEKFTTINMDGAQTPVYKTGDRVRWLPGGKIEFLGRGDSQIKLRGYRIELGEIQHTLETHPKIRQALITLSAKAPQALLGYVLTTEELPDASQSLRQFLRERLPEYMVPAHIIVLDALPTTLSGKVDFARLPLPALTDSSSKLISDDPLMSRLADIWQNVLGVPVDNPETHFFDLGGHSLLLVQLLARIQESFNIEMPLEKLFQHATLFGMARQIQLVLAPESSVENASAYSPLLAVLRDTGTQYPLFCIAPAGGTTHPYFALAHALGADYPVYALQDIAFATDAAPLPTIEAMAATYIEVMRQVQPHGPYYLAGWSFGGNVAYEMAQQLQLAGEAVPYIGMIEAFPTIQGRLQKPRVYRGFKARLSRIKHHLTSMILVGIDGLAATVSPLRREGDVAAQAQTLWQRWTNTLAWHLLLRNSDMNALLGKEEKLALIHQPLAGQFLRIATENLKALKAYEMKPYKGDIVLYVGLHDPALSNALDWGGTWKNYVTGNVDIHIHNADHFSIMRPPAILEVSEDVRRKIKKRPTPES